MKLIHYHLISIQVEIEQLEQGDQLVAKDLVENAVKDAMQQLAQRTGRDIKVPVALRESLHVLKPREEPNDCNQTVAL